MILDLSSCTEGFGELRGMIWKLGLICAILLWIPDEYQFKNKEKSQQKSIELTEKKKQIKPHPSYISFRLISA